MANGPGLVPSRSHDLWDYQTFPLASTCSALKGSLVALNGARDVIEYISTLSSFLGIITHDSVASFPAGKCVVAVPISPGATFWASTYSDVANSTHSVGQAMSITRQKAPDNTPRSYVSTLRTSLFSCVAIIHGPIDSASSRVECSFVWDRQVFNSNSSNTID